MAGTRRGNGEGSITQRPDGLWEARLTLHDGKRKSFYSKSYQEARRMLAKALRDRDRGALIVSDERLTVAGYVEQWLKEMRPNLRYSTYLRYCQLLAHVTRLYGELRLTRLTAAHLATLYGRLQEPDESRTEDRRGHESPILKREGLTSRRKPLSTTSVHHLHVVVRKALGDAVKRGLLATNVTDRVVAPRLRRSQREPFTIEETLQLLAAAQGDRLEALYVLAVTTGMRLGELLALTWGHIDLERGTLEVVASLQRAPGHGADAWGMGSPKTDRSRRRIDLTSIAVEALRAHRAQQLAERMAVADVWQDHGLVFCDTIGRHLNLQGVTRYQYRRLLRRAGLPEQRCFHELRHTTASLLFKSGVMTEVTSSLLGHASTQVTSNIYSHMTPGIQREAIKTLERIFAPLVREPDLLRHTQRP